MRAFAQTILNINRTIDPILQRNGVSSRGWCYIIEGRNLITKGQFNKVQNIINECRKKGILPIDFTVQDGLRSFTGIEQPESRTPIEYFKHFLKVALKSEEYYTPDWWEGEEYYIQMLVEKIDLKTIFRPVCQEYHIPIANTKGWYDIYLRQDLARRYKAAEERNLTPVLLYCGDFDPYGLAISDYLLKNLRDVIGGTRWDPENLIIDRFGLNFDFIVENNLSWIENLESGSGKDMSLMKNSIIEDYISQYGIRKCEANAIVNVPGMARNMCTSAIEKHLGEGSLERFEKKREKVREELVEYKKETGAQEAFQKIFGED